MMMIKHERPSNDLLSDLLSCPIGSFVSALLSHWSNESSTALAQILADQLNRVRHDTTTLLAALAVAAGKRKRTTLPAGTGFNSTPGSGVHPSVELMMTHLEALRTCLMANHITKSKSTSVFHCNFFHLNRFL